MKKIILLSLLYSAFSFSKDCLLDDPIDIRGIDLFKSEFELDNIILNKLPVFNKKDVYDPSKDTLRLRVKNLEWNDQTLNKLAVGISINDRLESIGFADAYYGNFEISSSKDVKNEITTYTTKQISRHSERPRHASNPAITKSEIKIKSNEIISIKLKYPIYKIWKKPSRFATSIAFTGNHDEVCLRNFN